MMMFSSCLIFQVCMVGKDRSVSVRLKGLAATTEKNIQHCLHNKWNNHCCSGDRQTVKVGYFSLDSHSYFCMWCCVVSPD